MRHNNRYKMMVDNIYSYLDVPDPDDQKQLLLDLVDFTVRLHSSWMDNDKPKTSWDGEQRLINDQILRIAKKEDLRVMVDGKEVVFRED